MITVDCRDIEPIKRELLVHVSDQVAAIPALKLHEFILSPIEEDDLIDITKVIDSIREYLDSIGEGKNFAVITQTNYVLIKSINGKPMEGQSTSTSQMYSCAHCGFITQYETEYNIHQKIHYL